MQRGGDNKGEEGRVSREGIGEREDKRDKGGETEKEEEKDGEDDDNVLAGNTAKGSDNAINGSCSVSSICEHTMELLSEKF